MTFAADHMSIHDSSLSSQDEGGKYTMSMAYLPVWQRPVLESENPYEDGYPSDGLAPRRRVQEIQVLKVKDYDAVKQAVYPGGGMQSPLYTPMKGYQSESVYYNRETSSYCYMGNEKSNRDFAIVGWDNSYSRENFNADPEGGEAFVCTSSWGEDFEDQGYFYMSYYDTNTEVRNIIYTDVK